MTLGERLSRIDAAQRSTRFKIIASAIVLFLLVVGVISLYVVANDPEIGQSVTQRAAQQGSAYERPSFFETGPLGSVLQAARTSVQVARGDEGITTIAGIVTAMAIGLGLIIWLGLTVTVIATSLAGWGLAWLFSLLEFTQGLGAFLTAAVPLVITFWVGMRAVAALLSGPWPWAAVARNVLNEAVRMKVSSVFIVLLIIVLALTPSLLTEDQPLRYRVQQWLQYGIGLSTVVLSLLTLFLAVATVSYEQRDRIIWQTMTKPIPRWQYLSGKWLGVMALNAVLLTVTAFGVYLFTEYLRYQPARGEAAYLIPASQAGEAADLGTMVDDRRILEEQILVARIARTPQPYRLTEATLDRMVQSRIEDSQARDPSFEDTRRVRQEIREEILNRRLEQLRRAVEDRIERKRANGERVPDTRPARQQIEQEIIEEWEQSYRTVPVNGSQVYNFKGLEQVYGEWDRFVTALENAEEKMLAQIDARVEERLDDPNNIRSEDEIVRRQSQIVMNEWKRSGRLPDEPKLMLRFRVNSGSNDPSLIYRITFLIPGYQPMERQVSLKAPQTMQVPLGAVTEDGWLSIRVVNGSIREGVRPNPRGILFEPDGLEVMYAVGGYELNFVRIMGVIFIKLGFIAAVAIAVATFLSFPVACLVALSILFMAESSVFLAESLDYFSVEKFGNREVSYLKVAAREISQPIAWMFRAYGELDPTSRLVDGLLVGWGTLFRALFIVGVWTLAALGIGLAIFHNRELGTYSGH